MDVSYIGATVSALSAAKDIAKAAVGIRDFNAWATTVSQLNEQILKAQDSLFSHQSQLIALQEELRKAKESLRLAEKLLEDRSRYELVELSAGVFVYRNKVLDVPSATHTEVRHFLCQPCFDAGRKAVLIRHESHTTICHGCPLCHVEYLESTKKCTSDSRPAGHWMA
ncbi:MAG TPA: hypothetical protein PK440_00680 [Candidatus Accumulibacter phosphatis]|nr:MAG: hypothetical protein AW07_00471 [Candidatus Accumulibacter sp. SK-11]HAY28979.1 hypothetical protein [Accumulibacter sp.]HCN67273.1 hypothetical protein [Accumulibacter sp.]HRL74228.1 hypothetical protein [Candidatus Accumulibacter phosphatis]HRQ93517.1 hypothetical protein [Candidatus Accumulibacter phosphatis]